MLDTITILIPDGGYVIFDHSRFTPSTANMKNNPAKYASYHNNATAEEKKQGIYLPKLTAYKRYGRFELKVEFSAPKLLFDNNLDEVSEAHFEQTAEALKAKMDKMGVKIFMGFLKAAPVSAFHPSKNITITNSYTSTFAMRELYKTDISTRFDIDKKIFRNNGEALQFYTNSHSIVFYDKITDLTKPSKRAIDKDQTATQRTLFDYLDKQTPRTELLRYEVRLIQKTKMKKILETVGYKKNNPTFEDIFKERLCQKILMLYWNEFFSDQLSLLDMSNKPLKVLSLVLRKYPYLKLMKAIFLTGLFLLCKDDEGMRGLRQTVERYKTKSSWTAIKRVLGGFRGLIATQEAHGFVKDIEKSLNEFRPYRVKNG